MSATVNQKRFMSHMAGLGCVTTGDMYSYQMHHIFGRECKVKGVGNIGHWAVMPLHYIYHDVSSNHEFNVTHNKNAFEQEFGRQVDLLHGKIQILKQRAEDGLIDINDLPDDMTVSAILNYRR